VKHFNTHGLTIQIQESAHFARDGGGTLYIYRDGFYKSGAENYIRQRVKELANESGHPDEWSSNFAKEVSEYIRADAPELWPIPPTGIINVENGRLDVITRELTPHSPEFLSPIQLPIRFDPTANGIAWQWFVEEVFPEDARDLAWEIAAWTMTPENSIQKAVLLTGEGANGKSVYLAGLTAFLGTRNVAGVSLHTLESDRFATASLVGKLANICPDLPGAKLTGTSIFKAVTGGDLIRAERKFRDSFEFRPYAKLIFSANQLPTSDDATHAFFRRQLIVPFVKTFDEKSASTIPRAELDALLAEPAELSVLLNLALDALPRLRSRGFTESDSTQSALEEYRRIGDPLVTWLEANVVDDPAGEILKRKLIDGYRAACVEAKRPLMTDTAFGRALHKARPSISSFQKNRQEAYRGMSWKPESKYAAL
jgi:putative DNA primase/helicase